MVLKVGIIGVGSVGGAIASRMVADGISRELVLIDTDMDRARAAAADLSHAAALGRDVKINAGNYRMINDANIVIISAGANQRIGQSRSDLVEKNAAVMIDIVPKIMSVADRRRIILIIATNPLDSMVTAAQKISRIPPARVIGTGTMLDSARLRFELSRHFDVSPTTIDAYVSGEHGDASIINWDAVSIDGISLAEFAARTRIPLTAKMRADIENRVRGAAMEIIKGRGATWDGIAAVTSDLATAIARDERRILPVSIVDPKFRVAYSVPRIVGQNGAGAGFLSNGLAPSIRSIQKTYRIIA